MVVRNIPRDIAKYESKLLLGFTTRQVVFVIPGIIIAVGLYFLLKDKLGELAIVAAIASAVPFMLFGTVKPLGMKMEKFIAKALLPLLLAPTNRKYIGKNTYADVFKPAAAPEVKNKKYVSKNPECKALK